MQKFIDNINSAQAYTNLAGGLNIAKTICRRKLLETNNSESADLILSIIAEINLLVDFAETNIKQSLDN